MKFFDGCDRGAWINVVLRVTTDKAYICFDEPKSFDIRALENTQNMTVYARLEEDVQGKECMREGVPALETSPNHPQKARASVVPRYLEH